MKMENNEMEESLSRINEQNSNEVNPVQKNSSNFASSINVTDKLIVNKFPKDICKFFQANRWCKFGGHCRYSHNHSGNLLADIKSKGFIGSHDEKVDADDLTSISRETIVILDRVPNVEPKTVANDKNSNSTSNINDDNNCIFFMKGYCKFGRHCRFRHDKEHRSIVRSKLKIEANFKKSSSIPANVRNFKSSAAKNKECLISTQVNQTSGKSDRTIEVEQFLKRYPDAMKSDVGQSTVLKFFFSSTDPDWPFLVKQISVQYSLPQNYPQEKLEFCVIEDGVIPALLITLIEEEGNKWIDEMCTKMPHTMLVRPMLKWLDNHLEDMFTRGLTQLKLERQAQAAGLEFITSTQLKKKYAGSQNGLDSTKNLPLQPSQPNIINDQLENYYKTESVEPTSDVEKENLNSLKENDENVYLLNELRTGTELSFRDFEFSRDTIATIALDSVGLIVVCGRCKRKFDLNVRNQKTESLVCVYCKQGMWCKLRSSLVHAQSHVIGFIDAVECAAVDCVLPDCQFTICCLNCNHCTPMTMLATGQANHTWCRNCHKKFTVFTNNIKILKLAQSLDLKPTGVKKEVGIPKKIKAVKDEAIQEGQPLPDFGICRHFKKSFRWFRFPCCGKAYPCDVCHDQREDHEMKRANRMICGFCAHEQAFSSEKPCSSCNHYLTNKSTSHWEGGKGCRDVIKMARNDAKKYKGASHPVSTKELKTTKLRHSS